MRFTLTSRVLAKVRRAVRSPICPWCRVRHAQDVRSTDFLLCRMRGEQRRQRRATALRALVAIGAANPYDAIARDPQFDVTYERFVKRKAEGIATALNLTFEQADGARPLTGDDLFTANLTLTPPRP